MTPDTTTGRHEFTPSSAPFEYIQNLFPEERKIFSLNDRSVVTVEKGLHPIGGRPLQSVIKVSHFYDNEPDAHERYLFSKFEVLLADWDPQKTRFIPDYPLPSTDTGGVLTNEERVELHQARLTTIASALQAIATQPI